MVNLKWEKKAHYQGYQVVAGCDEAGRGPLAGPVVAAAVIIKKNSHFCERIDDSKRLSARLRGRAFDEISEKCFIGIGIISHRQIDKINILNATCQAMRVAVSNLKLKPDRLLIDGNVRISAPYFSTMNIIHGDSKSLSIACASIVAKVIRDRIMAFYNSLFPEYGFIQHKGYATQEHINAILTHGPSPIHRMSFRPLRDIVYA